MIEKPLTQLGVIIKAWKMVLKEKIKPSMTSADWAKVLHYMHKKGWLYVNIENGEIKVLIGGYRVKDVKENNLRVLPEKEEGDIFYAPFYLPRDRKLPLGATRRFFRKNKEIKKIVFEDDNNKLKEYKMHLKR